MPPLLNFKYFGRFLGWVCRYLFEIKPLNVNFENTFTLTIMNIKMKLTIAFAAIFVFAFLNSCNSGNAASSPNAVAVHGSGSHTAGTDAVFSYTLQGKKISGGPVDVVQVSNIAYIQNNGQTKNLQFFLNDGTESNSSNFAHSLRFTVIDISSTRVSGTFSGKMKSSAGDEQTIADGKFDVPVGKTGK